MAEPISTADVAHIARLANLHLDDDELERFTSQLGDILNHASDMAAVDLEGVEPTAHPFPLVNVMAADEPVPSLDRDAVLASAPAVEQHMFRVPPVMGQP